MASNDYFCVMNMLHNQSKDLVEKNYYYFVKIINTILINIQSHFGLVNSTDSFFYYFLFTNALVLFFHTLLIAHIKEI